MVIISTMLKIIVALALGYLLNKIKILNSEANSAMSKLVINATSPALIFSSVAGMSSDRKDEAVFLLWIGVVIYIFLAVIAFIVVKLLRVPHKSFSTYICIMVFGNVGFLGFPIAQSLYGALGLFYIGILNIHFTLFAYTFGMLLMTGGSKDGDKPKLQLKTLVNPGTIGVVLALVFFLLEIPIPDVIMAPVSFIGQITSPLAMIILGSTLATYSMKKIFSNWRNYVVSALRLLIIPAISYMILNSIWGTSEMTVILTLYIGCPTATILVMMSLAYGGDVENSSNCIGLMTILSMVTIPSLWFFIRAVAA